MFGDHAKIKASLSALERAVTTSPDTNADISKHLASVFVIGPPDPLGAFFVPTIQRGAGVVLTTDGYVVVDYSVVGQKFDEWQRSSDALRKGLISRWWAAARKKRDCIISFDGKDYPLDIGFLAADPSTNMALIKAYMPKVRRPAPSGIGFYGGIEREGDNITLLGLPNESNVPVLLDGKVTMTKKGSFLTNIGTPYDFDSSDYLDKAAFVNQDGELAGIPLIFRFTKESVVNGISAPLIQQGLQKLVVELRNKYETRVAAGK